MKIKPSPHSNQIVYGEFKINISNLVKEISDRLKDEASEWLYKEVKDKFEMSWSLECIEKEIVSRTVDKIVEEIVYKYQSSSDLRERIINGVVKKMDDRKFKDLILETLITRSS